MFKKDKDNNKFKQTEPTPVNTVIGPEVVFSSGSFYGGGVVSVFGKLECLVEISGQLRVEQTGIIEGNIFAADITVDGQIFGDIEASRLIITGTGVVNGNISCAKLSVSEGGMMNGICSMKKDFEPQITDRSVKPQLLSNDSEGAIEEGEAPAATIA